MTLLEADFGLLFCGKIQLVDSCFYALLLVDSSASTSFVTMDMKELMLPVFLHQNYASHPVILYQAIKIYGPIAQLVSN